MALTLVAAPVTRDSPAPPGPDPYKLVRDDIELIKTSIKKMLTANKGEGAALAQNEVLSMAAREFTARQGKSFRPMIVLLVGALAGLPARASATLPQSCTTGRASAHCSACARPGDQP